jgi:hypothetical protein
MAYSLQLHISRYTLDSQEIKTFSRLSETRAMQVVGGNGVEKKGPDSADVIPAPRREIAMQPPW